MYLRRFRGTTLRETLARAKQELGPDALVLSTRLVPRAGWGWLWGAREVEVTVGAERDVSDDRPPAQESRQAAVSNPITARLCATGLDATLAQEVAEALPAPGRRGASLVSLRRVLGERLGALAAADDGFAPIEVFVGPAGAGKTTTIAKIAAQARVRDSGRLTIVSADGYRVGAVEQLRLYADIIGAPFQAVRSASDLLATLAAGRRPILVDTAGRSPTDSVARELFAVIAARPEIRTHLVVPAGCSVRELDRLLAQYREARPTRLALTKLDEVETLSPLVGALRRHDLPISYLGTGQRVPEDLDRATGSRLAAWVLGEREFAMGRTA